MPGRSWSQSIALACRVADWSMLSTQSKLTGKPSKSRGNSTTLQYALWQISVSPTISWCSHALVTIS